MKNVRTDLIHEELYGKHADGLIYHQFGLHKRYVERIMNHYYCTEMCEMFYDSEPDIDDDLYDMYYDYNFTVSDPWNLPEYEGKNYTKEDFKEASEKVKQITRDYWNSERRLTFGNWVEPYFEGNWGMTQKRVDEVAYENLEHFRKYMPHKDRCYMAYDKENESIRVYLYGRDKGCDLWFIFKKRKRRLKKLIKITNYY